MPALRPFVMLHTEDQWRRAAHAKTRLDSIGAVRLADGQPDDTDHGAPGPAASPAGMAFDPWCRLYHSIPEEGRVERVLWAKPSAWEPNGERPGAANLFAIEEAVILGDFSTRLKPLLNNPGALVVDDDGRLFIAEIGTGRILIYDVFERRTLRTIVAAPTGTAVARPLDLATDGQTVYVVADSPARVGVLTARSDLCWLTLPKEINAPSRIAIDKGGDFLLLTAAGSETAAVVRLRRSHDELRAAWKESKLVDWASDVEIDDDGRLVVPRRPNEDFLRFSIGPEGPESEPPLKARDYDGRGIVRTPDGRIGFWTRRGFRNALQARPHYERRGRVTTFRLDSGAFQTVWGRLFIDACIPADTEVRVHCSATDDSPENEGELPRTPVANVTEPLDPNVVRPDLSPPMPPLSLVPGEDEVRQALHRRETGREVPWVRRDESDAFATYEAPVLARAGRYLWVTLELRGNARSTPRIRSLRIEYPSHNWLRLLPKIYSRDGSMASFLRRYLAILEGAIGELDARASLRRVLLDPRSTPAEILPWLAGFVGLLLDERLSENAKRNLIAEATWLFRFRGTVPGLRRFLRICTGRDPILVEHYRTRGLGGAIVGEDSGLPSRAIVGAGFRVGGAVGTITAVPVQSTESTSNAFDTHAHRFSVVLTAALDDDLLAVAQQILELHRPAHTLYNLCVVDAGMRLGIGLYVDLNTIVGRSGGFTSLQLDRSRLGRETIVGRPSAGVRIGASRLGADSRSA